jgi:arsenite transporter
MRGALTNGVDRLERHQVPLYLAALLVGAGVGLGVPAVAEPATLAINPVLGLLLYATFLGVPFPRLALAVRDGRFLVTVLVLNFAAVPLVAFGLSRVVAQDPVLVVGVLFVLLTPCVDYVIVFTRLAGGAAERLLAATPLLMLAQMAALPVYLRLMVGESLAQAVDVGPFVEAFVLLIAVPLVAAWLTQVAATRWRVGRWLRDGALAAMVPLMMLTLAVVVASQIHDVGTHLGALLAVVPVYLSFALAMVALGWLAGRAARLDAPARRAVVFSGVTRNSLVVLPLVLALPAPFDLAPLVVVTQTLVELVVMVVLVHLVPRIVGGHAVLETET